jgi:FkbM family methyltransferase
VGSWTRTFLDLYPTGTVIALEAQPDLAGALHRVAAQYSNVTVVSAVLAADESARDFFVCRGDRHRTGSSLLPEMTGLPIEARRVKTVTLDRVLEGLALPEPINLLKLDTQGSELEILRGATETLETVSFLQLEVSLCRYNEGAPLLAEAVAFLYDRGFFAFDIFDRKLVPTRQDLLQVDFLFSRRPRSVSALPADVSTPFR